MSSSFHYPHPESNPSNRLAGLSEETRIALTNIAMGPSSAQALLGGNTDNTNGTSMEDLRPEVQQWAEEGIGRALDKWKTYAKTGLEVPANTTELQSGNPNFAKIITRLYEAKTALDNSAEITPEGQPIGETMELVLIPWGEMYNAVFQNQFKEWLWTLRQNQGAQGRDDLNVTLLKGVRENEKMYRIPSSSNTCTALEHLVVAQSKVEGDWGIMLAQTSDVAGIERLKGQSPDTMTGNDSRHLEIAGQKVDAMGIFEWIALTLQEDPRTLSSQDYSWLLANRLEVDGGTRVPAGYSQRGRVKSYLSWSDNAETDARPRLAVM